MSIIKLSNVSKFYYNKNNISAGFSKINLELNMGEFVVITGESGSGKSTLLNVISGLDSYEEGEMYINGEETSHYTEVDYENYRRKYIGNIFQHFNLVNSYTVYQNVELVLLLNGYKKKEVKKKVLEIIKTVGLDKYKNTKASKLSGGQKQRVAIARALAKDTPIIVADEPTGNLDVKSAKDIMKLLKDISINKLVVIVTHNYEQVQEYATRKISMNDGKIIEDKSLQKYNVVEPEEVAYKDLRPLNKFLIGFRNAFNIKTKFGLLFLVYFFLTLLVFAEYSSLAKQEYDESIGGYNYYFQEINPERVILKKNDSSAFTNEEITSISKLNNIARVEQNDLLLDFDTSVYGDDVYFYGKSKNSSLLSEVDVGRIPINEDEIVIGANKDSYYFISFGEGLLNKTMTLQNNNDGSTIAKVKIVGLKYEETDSIFSEETIYLTESTLNKINLGLYASYSDVSITLNNKTFIQKDYRLYYQIMSNEKVPDGQTYVFQELNAECEEYSCLNKNLTVNISNIYYEDKKELKITKVLSKENFKSSTGLNFDDYSSVIFLSVNDYKNLFYKDNYQISVFLENTKEGNDTIKELKSLGYTTYYMKENLVNELKELMGILNIIRSVAFIIATAALFFISYFIIKIIMKSRNVYFSTIRILGATKKVAKNLLNIELFIDINIAYLAFLGIILFAKSEIIKLSYITDMISYFTLRDYILIYAILVVMSLLISNRYSHKLFKDSVMSTYREEV